MSNTLSRIFGDRAVRAKLGVLATLYFVQGLPYGFQLIALPVYLRSRGVSLTAIGFAGALSLPWVLKALWGPPVDRFGSARFGRRRSWIVPLQIGLVVSCGAAAMVPEDGSLVWLLAAVLSMSFFASTMDVAVDGLAIDVLERSELGLGNIAQVVGYKLGILTGGGLLVWASGVIGWRGLFLGMAILAAGGVWRTLSFSEHEIERARIVRHVPSMRGVFTLLVEAMKTPGTAWLVLFIGTYKLGEAMADAMFKPFLFDAGFDAQQIGLWVGSWGMSFSIAGSVAGGVLASRIGFLPAVGVTATLRAIAVGGEWYLAVTAPTLIGVIVVTSAEQLFGGALTTAMFAFMMSRVDRRIGASHYTLLATVEVAGKLPAGWFSGVIADRFGYPVLFGLATVLAVAFLGLLRPLSRVDRLGSGASSRVGD